MLHFLIGPPEEIDLDENSLADTIDDCLQEFNVPWAKLSNTAQGREHEEEKREVTRHLLPEETVPRRGMQIRDCQKLFQDYFRLAQTLECPRPRYSDDKLDSAHVASRGNREDSDTIVTNMNNNQVGAPAHIALDIGDFDFAEEGDS